MIKGDKLEVAVKAIESVVLRTSPSYNEKSFVIYSNKIYISNGVRHEIDIWVDIDLGRGYKAVFIFECKNWVEKVGKNEVIVFSEKIDATAAQKGIFIANSFTSDARAQAAKDPRMELLLSTEYPAENTPAPFDFHFIIPEMEECSVTFNERGESQKRQLDALVLSSASAVLNGKSINLEEYARRWASEEIDIRLSKFQSQLKSEGLYQQHFTSERHYEKGDLLVNERDISSAYLTVKFTARLTRPPVISDFQVETRGRAISLAPVEVSESGLLIFTFVGLS